MAETTTETRQPLTQVYRDERFLRDMFLSPERTGYDYFSGRKYRRRRTYYTGTDPRYASWDYETGMPMGPVPTGRDALMYQDYAEGLARQRQSDLWSDAQRSMELAGQSFSQYRNNAASRLQAGLYQNQAGLYAQQAGTITAPDVLGGWREEQRQQALREARKARRKAETMQWVGLGITAVGSLLGGVGAIAGAGIGAGLNAAANNELGNIGQQQAAGDQAAQEDGEAWRGTAGGAGGGLTLPGGEMPFSGDGAGGGSIVPSPQGNVAPPSGAPTFRSASLQPQGQPGGGGGYLPQQQQGSGYVAGGAQQQGGPMARQGGGQMGGGGGQQAQRQRGGGMVAPSPAESALPIMLAQVLEDDSSIDEFYAGLRARTAMISSGAYLG